MILVEWAVPLLLQVCTVYIWTMYTPIHSNTSANYTIIYSDVVIGPIFVHSSIIYDNCSISDRPQDQSTNPFVTSSINALVVYGNCSILDRPQDQSINPFATSSIN